MRCVVTALLSILCFFCSVAILWAKPNLEFNCKNSATHEVVCQVHIDESKLIDVFALSNPKRVVVDLKANKSKSPPHVSSKLVAGVSNLRVGTHPDKIRIVVDLAETAFDQVTWQKEVNKATISLTRASNKESGSEDLSLAINQAIQENEETARNLADNDSFAVDHDEESEDPSQIRAGLKREDLIRMPDTEAEISGQVLKDLDFLFANNGEPAQVLFVLSEPPEFSLAQISNRVYRIKIPNAKLQSEELGLPYFPPQDFPKIVYIQSEQEDHDLVLKVGVEQGTKLRAIADEKSILVQIED